VAGRLIALPAGSWLDRGAEVAESRGCVGKLDAEGTAASGHVEDSFEIDCVLQYGDEFKGVQARPVRNGRPWRSGGVDPIGHHAAAPDRASRIGEQHLCCDEERPIVQRARVQGISRSSIRISSAT